MVRKHINRDFSDHRKNRFRPEDEFYKIEIISFDHDYTKEYIVTDGTINGSNTKKKSWKGWTTYMPANKDKSYSISCDYFVHVDGEYRIDIVYETFTDKDLTGSFMGSPMKYEGAVNHLKRKTIFKDLSKGNLNISAVLPPNVYLYGLIVRKTREYIGDSLGSFGTNVLLEKVNDTISSQINPSEISFEIGYDSAFEYLGSPTGLYMDYNDEVNVYVQGVNDEEPTQIFGGYLSSILPDNNKTVLNISCADRMIDGQNRYILTRMRLLGGATLPTEDVYTSDMDVNFDTYGGALKYLCECIEITLNNNIGSNDLVTYETAEKGFNIEFGKKKKINKITTKNSTATFSKNFVTLRNKPEASKKQEMILYLAKNHTNVPHDITDYDKFTLVYGLGNPEVSHDEKSTQTVGTVGAGSQKFNKCGVSADGKYVMAIGLPSASGELGKYGYTWYKRVYERKCPACGSTNLVFDIFYGGSSGAGTPPCKGTYESGGGVEGHVFCKGCDADWSIFGKPHGGTSKHLKSASSLTKSSKSEAQKLKNGKMEAVPKTGVSVSSDDIFKAISDYAFKHFKYKLEGSTYSTASGLEKHGYGDCWAFSEWIYKQLKKYKVNNKVVQYKTKESDQHRSVLYQAKSGKYVDFPYREYGWGTKYNNMLNNTSGSKKPNSTPFKYTSGGSIEQATTKKDSTTETSTVHVTTGYSRDKPLQGYFAVEFSMKDYADTTKPTFKDKTKTVYVGFTQKAASTLSLTGFSPVWINNSTKQISVDLLDFIRKTIANEQVNGKKKYFLHSIKFIAPVNKVVDSEKSNQEGKTVYKVEDWYTYDKSTHDNSSCKMDLYSMNFNNSTLINPSDLDSCGKNITSLMADILTASKYTASKQFAKHRCDDIINFSVDNQTEPKFIAHEGDDNNILRINGISYSPRSKLFNNSTVVFKNSSDRYKFVESRSPQSVLKYQEQTSLITSNEKIGSKEAYYMAINNTNYNPSETFDFSVVLPYFVPLQVGDLVQVIANSKKLNTIKTVASVKYDCDHSQIPKIQTEVSLGELPIDIQIKKDLQEIRKMAKKETTSFSGTAEPIEDIEIYEWDN